jgi:prepilin-type N-terminal cleavage/methylation domain-containing protein
MKTTLNKSIVAKGFSLIEMLVVIAVIGVIAAIAIPSIGSINDSAKQATAQRNAQSIASMWASGAAAGIKWSTSMTVADQAAAVIAGAAPTSGSFSGKTFVVPNIAGTDLTNAEEYLSISNGQLTYNANAAFTPN